LLQIAFVGIFTSTFNILPLLKLDGYYLLADALEIPQLRERSIDFIVHRLRSKLAKRKKWSREEIIFLLFGILALLSTFYFTYAGVVFWDSQASTSLSELLNLNGDIKTTLFDFGTVIIALSAIYLAFALLVDGLKKLYVRFQNQGVLSNRWRAAAILLILALLLTLLPSMLLPTLAMWFLLLGGISSLVFVSWLFLSNFRAMRGSIYAWMWVSLSLAALVGAASFLDEFNVHWAGLAVLGREAALGLFLISLLFAGRLIFDLRGSWHSLSLILLLVGAELLAAPAFITAPIELNTLASLLMLAGMLHWRMRPPTQIQAGKSDAVGSTREKMMTAYREIRASILIEVELDFGMGSRKRVESGAYRLRKKTVGAAKFSRSMTGMTPNDYGGALALELDELLISVERLGGRKYAWRALAYGYDKLQWGLQEIAEDYILKYVAHASGLSNILTQKRDDLKLLLHSIPLFKGIPEASLIVLSKQFQPCKFKAGDEIVHAGDSGDSFYLVRAGRLEVVGNADFANDVYKSMHAIIDNDHAMFFSTKPRRIAQLTRGDYFGESALLKGTHQEATVRALTPAEVLRLGKPNFDRLVRSNLSFGASTQQEIRRMGLLRQLPLFEGFDGSVLQSIVQKLETVKFNAGDAVFRQGDSVDEFYIIENGKVGIIIDGTQRATLGVGEYFGEMALLMNTPRTATVIALQPLTLLQLHPEDFNQLIQASSDMKQALERTSSRRILSNERWAGPRRAV
ncbi:MAG TPA: cyclic nucleotide-binding domain-containing protein, partial [Anaerolineales bacterium]|nr:cyclic nucleotide-binding domain-containing protein [Anaerolineales bacterium]